MIENNQVNPRPLAFPSLTSINATLGGRSASAYNAELEMAEPGELVRVPVSDSVNGTYVADARIEPPRADPAYGWGSPQLGPWEEIDPEAEAKVGDRLRFTYHTSIPWFQDWQMAAVRRIWELRSDFEVTSALNYSEESLIVIEGTVLKPFSPVIYVAGAIAAAVVGVALYLSVAKIERLGEITIEKAGSWIGPILAGVVALLLINAWKK